MNCRLASLTLVGLVLLSAGLGAQESASSGIAVRSWTAPRARCRARPSPSRTSAPTRSASTVTDGKDGSPFRRFRPPPITSRSSCQGSRPRSSQNFVAASGRDGAADDHARRRHRQRIVTVTGEVAVAADAERIGRAGDQREADRRSAVERPHRAVAGIALGGRDAAETSRAARSSAPPHRRNQFITVEGGRDSSTNYTIDGVYVRSLRFNNLSLNPPIDAVQEVSLLRNSFSTEYGQGQAVVSIVTKSGTNQLHGSAYEFYPRRSVRCAQFLRADEAGIQAQPVRRHRRRAADAQQVLRVWRL